MNLVEYYCSNPRVIRQWILFEAEFTYQYRSFKRHCNEVYLSCRSESKSPEEPDCRKRAGSSADILKKIDFVAHPRLIQYQKISCFIMICIAIKDLIRWESFIARFNPALPPHCYVLGRFFLYGPPLKYLSSLIALYHIYWRFTKYYVDRYNKWDVVSFIIHDQDAINRNYCHNGEIRDVTKLSADDNYITKIMYYTVSNKSKFILRLRPNRTKECREIFIRVMAFLETLYSLLRISGLPFFALIIYSAANDLQYVRDYPMCHPQLDELNRKQEIYWYSMTFTGHKLISFLFDFMENFFIWVDSLFTVAWMMVFPLLLHLDLCIYWIYVNKHLERQIVKMHLQHCQRQVDKDFDERCYYNWSNAKLNLTDLVQECHKRGIIEVDTHGTQELLRDFFEQIRIVNQTASQFIFSALLVWESYFCLSVYLQLVHSDDKVSIQSLRIIIVVILFFLLFLCYLYFYFRRNVLKTYSMMATLMAYDTSSHKAKYTSLMEFYLQENYAGYTIGPHQPLTPTTVLTVAGWSISCAVLLLNYTLW